MPETSSHIGRKICRIRELRGMKQEALAFELGISQQAVSKMEQSEKLEDAVLQRVANALGVSPEAVQNYSDEAVIYNIQNYAGANSASGNFAQVVNNNCTFNPMDKLVEAMDEIRQLHAETRKLYEQLLAAEREKLAILKQERG